LKIILIVNKFRNRIKFGFEAFGLFIITDYGKGVGQQIMVINELIFFIKEFGKVVIKSFVDYLFALIRKFQVQFSLF